MIDIRLTNEETIQLQSFLSNRNLLASDARPLLNSRDAVIRNLLNAASKSAVLDSVEQKLTAELDNLLQVQNLKQQASLKQQAFMAEILQKRADTNDE